MTDELLRQAFLDLCKAKGLHIGKDINDVLFGVLTGEEIFEVFKYGQLTCPYCGKIVDNKLNYKYHLTCYCDPFQNLH
jgi:hypothetical protein